MKVIKPTAFTSSMLVSTTATDSDPAWVSTTSYTNGSLVVYNGRTYRSVHNNAHSGNQPDTSPTYWVDIGPSNRFAMFDRTVTYGTTADTPMEFVIKPGVIDSLALINLKCDLAHVVVRDGLNGPIVYENTVGLSGTNVNDWYEYFFYDPLLKRTQVIMSNIPPYADAHVTVTLTAGTGKDIEIGECIFGSFSAIGGAQYGATAGIIDYSRKETDEFGNVTFVERPFSKRITVSVHVRNNQLNRVQQLMYSLRATPVVWVASEDPALEEALVVYGFYRDFSTDISYPTHSVMSLEIEGLT